MNLDKFGENWKKECSDIKGRPMLYILKLTANILFLYSYYLIVSPFFNSVEILMLKLGYVGMITLMVITCLKKLAPPSILALCSGDIVNQIDNVQDMKKINCFYMIVLACSFLAVSFIKQIKDSIIFLYGDRANNK